MANRIQFKRGVKASLPTLSVGEPAITTDSKEFYIGSAAGNMSVAMDTDMPSVPVVLSPGVQTIRVDRTSRLAHIGFKGRTLVNLLGREGNCESISSWSVVGTRAIDSTVKTSGSNSIKLTLSGTNGNINQLVSTFVVGKKYVVVADVKNGNAANGCVSISEVVDGNKVSSTTFSPSYLRFTATKTAHIVAFVGFGSSGQTINVDSIRIYEVSEADYNAIGSMTPVQVAAKYPYTEGIANVDNVYIHRLGSVGAVEQALYAYDMQASSNVDGSIRDEVYTDKDGRLRINRRLRTMELKGDLEWGYSTKGSGFKQVYLPVASGVTDSALVIKHDGKIIPWAYPAVAGDQNFLSVSKLYLSISNTDSGWGDAYTPTVDEIKAYFYGYRMCNADGTPYTGGAKGWNQLYAGQSGVPTTAMPGGGVVISNTYTSTIPTTQATGYTPYQLQYQLSSPIDEPVNQEGAITLLAGANQIEMGSGVIVRERANAQLGGAGEYLINHMGFVGGLLKRRTAKVLGVYEDNQPFNKYTIGTVPADTYGKEWIYISVSNYDTTAVYTVTYMALDTYLTGIPPLTITADIAANLRGAVDGAVTDIAALTGRVDVLESGKADAEQPGWIAPTLLNGWVNFGAPSTLVGYFKDQFGYVHIRGFVKSGTASGYIFMLPPGYKPTVIHSTAGVSANGSSILPCRLYVDYLGGVGVEGGGNAWLTLDTVFYVGRD